MVSTSDRIANCYTPVEGGWQILITDDPHAKRLPPNSDIGVIFDRQCQDLKMAHHTFVADDPRLHRRPLYPPSDKGLLFDGPELEKVARGPFRPIIIAYNAPRFVLDIHSAGGLFGQLRLGAVAKTGESKWLDQWTEVEAKYVDGRMEYCLRDPVFPGVSIRLLAIALSESIGFMVHYQVEGISDETTLVSWYGGASASYSIHSDSEEVSLFKPEHCSENVFAWNEGTFSLHRPFSPNDACCTAGDYLLPFTKLVPEWKPCIKGGDSNRGYFGFADPHAVLDTPKCLLDHARWVSAASENQKTNCVALRSVRIDPHHNDGYITIGMGGNIEHVLENPESALKASMSRNRDIAGRMVTKTPDPYLDAAVQMMAFGHEGFWGDVAYLCGGWSWRWAFVGWRATYGPDCYGWTDRVRKHIQSHIRQSVIQKGPDKGALSFALELQEPGIYYNINEVFLDQVRHYFQYTGDLKLVRDIFPALEGIVEWEDRRLRPTDEYLYESCLNTWISDSHWYIRGQCTQASAYMLSAYTFLADIARRLGENPDPFIEMARHIVDALQRKLWMSRKGVYAEYMDTRGHCLLHPEPELPTIYHAAEFGAADSLQTYQMLHWADSHLKQEQTAGAGKAYWSSNWFPNQARLYTHTTHDIAYAEELNFALAHYLAGRADDAYALIRGCLCGIFNGPTPGGLSCQNDADGRQRYNGEFNDSGSMWGRTIMEGLFGVVPKRPDDIVELCPQFPTGWTEASIRTQHFSYEWRASDGCQMLAWQSPLRVAVHLRLPVQASMIKQVEVDGCPISWETQTGVGLTWLVLRIPSAMSGTVKVLYTPTRISVLPEEVVIQNEPFSYDLPGSEALNFIDPQSVLKDAVVKDHILSGVVNGEAGPRLMFVEGGTRSCPVWLPLRIRILPNEPQNVKTWSPLRVAAGDLSYWKLVDMSKVFNHSFTDVVDHFLASAKPPALPASQIGFDYRNIHLSIRMPEKPSDAAWRKKVGPDGIAWTTDNIPFKTNREGYNIAAVSLEGDFPHAFSIPIKARGKSLYLMLSGLTFPAQSHVPNFRITLKYADGTVRRKDFVNPFDIGDCWGTWLGRFHDNQTNGFENLGGRYGPAGSSEVEDLRQPIAVDTEAHLIELALQPGVEVDTLTLEAVANDVVFGLMGLTILR